MNVVKDEELKSERKKEMKSAIKKTSHNILKQNQI